MNTSLLFRAALLGIVVLLLMAAWQVVKEADDGMKFLFFICVGVGGGLWAVKVFIPWVGEALGTFFYSSGEEVTMDESMRAVAKVAQGDYEGAIEEYEKLTKSKPEDPHPVAEIAKILCDRLDDPDSAVAVLNKHLQARTWAEDDAAFLMFRLAEVQSDKRQDHAAARAVLERVIAQFPNTRHSANAHHRLHEVDQAQFKHLRDQRLKGGGAV